MDVTMVSLVMHLSQSGERVVGGGKEGEGKGGCILPICRAPARCYCFAFGLIFPCERLPLEHKSFLRSLRNLFFFLNMLIGV